MNLHTPGPWSVCTGKIEKSLDKGRLIQAVWAGNDVVAICENQANATLIAAAPQMLGALRTVYAYLEDPHPSDAFELDHIIALLRNTIDQATGELSE